LSPGQASRSLADSVPTASSTTGFASSTAVRESRTARQSASPTSMVTAPVEGGAVKIDTLWVWSSVVGLVSHILMMRCENDGLTASRPLCQ
jgi:hypothetical protein